MIKKIPSFISDEGKIYTDIESAVKDQNEIFLRKNIEVFLENQFEDQEVNFDDVSNLADFILENQEDLNEILSMKKYKIEETVNKCILLLDITKDSYTCIGDKCMECLLDYKFNGKNVLMGE